MDFELINTEHLTLRKINAEVLNYVYKHLSDDELINFLGINSIQELTLEKEKFKKGLITHNKKFLYFHLIENKTGQVIGWCGYHTWYTDHQRAELGYGIYQENWKRKGLMSEALIPIIAFGFNQMDLHRIEAFIGPSNVPSLKLITKFNFKKEGELKEHYFYKNRYENSVVYSLLKKEYQP